VENDAYKKKSAFELQGNNERLRDYHYLMCRSSAKKNQPEWRPCIRENPH